MITKTKTLILLIFILTIGLVVAGAIVFKDQLLTKPQHYSPQISPTPFLTWQVYTNPKLAISFQYPKNGSLMENMEKLADGTIVDVDQSIFVTVPVQCNFENSGYFVIEVSNTPPGQGLLNYLTTPHTIGGKEAKGSTYVPLNLQSDGRDSEMYLVEHKNRYYLIKDETCTSKIGKQIIESLNFL